MENLNTLESISSIRKRFNWDATYRQSQVPHCISEKEHRASPGFAEASHSQKGGKHTKKQKDIFTETPVRYIAFSNELGAAVSSLITRVGEAALYIPALTYIFLDVRDKYKRGKNDDYKEPSLKRGAEQMAFHSIASILLPITAIKTGQTLAEAAIDSMPKTKNKIKSFVTKRPRLDKFIGHLAEKPHGKEMGTAAKFAHKFIDVVEHICVVPKVAEHMKLEKLKKNGITELPKKSGLRNLGLAVAGLTSLAVAIKPIDWFGEHIIVKKVVHPALSLNENKNLGAKKLRSQ